MQEAELASVAAELYALSPGDFTAARDERVAQARASGDRGLARAIGALRRPVVSAWLVNQLVRAAGDQVGELLALGESLRQAHQDLAGEQVRDLSVRRRQLVAALLAEAKRIAERDGRPAGLQVEREVEATLQAALADPGAAEAVRAGCLSSPLSYAGLGAGDEAGAVSWQRAPARERAPAGEQAPAGERPPAREKAPARASGRRAKETAAEREARLAAAEAERQARQAAAEAERRAAAEQAVRTAADAATAAAADLAGAEARAASARTARGSARRLVERLDRELSQAIAAESEANRAVRDAQRAKEAAARAADAAQRRLARAQTAADRLG